MSTKQLKIGGVTIPFATAEQWIRQYTDGTKSTSRSPFAYPAYDFLDTGSSADELNDGDLLAPLLLNAAPRLSAFYRLQHLKTSIADALANRDLDTDLAKLTDTQIENAVGPVYSLLDEEIKNFGKHGLGGTTYSKVVHRKRSKALCLHDRWIRACYVGDGRPVPQASVRSWEDYMVLLSKAMRSDLHSQRSHFESLRDAVPDRPVSDLRILDILAWTSRGISV